MKVSEKLQALLERGKKFIEESEEFTSYRRRYGVLHIGDYEHVEVLYMFARVLDDDSDNMELFKSIYDTAMEEGGEVGDEAECHYLAIALPSHGGPNGDSKTAEQISGFHLVIQHFGLDKTAEERTEA